MADLNDIFNYPDADDPTEIAEQVARKFSAKGYKLDFSIASLKNEIDRILKKEPKEEKYDKTLLEAELTAYFGESICRIFKAKWHGQYFGPFKRSGINYYSCRVRKNEFEFSPNHFFGYYFTNGSKRQHPFKGYLEGYKSYFEDQEYVVEGLLIKLKKAGK